MTHAYIAFGSNLGDRDKIFLQAIELLASIPRCTLKSHSDLIETVPVVIDDQKQPAYLNACIAINTELGWQEFFDSICEVELKLGRQRKSKWAARNVDLDLLMFGDQLIWRPGLQVPHQRMSYRQFVLQPLLQIAREFVHPFCGVSIEALVNHLQHAKNVVVVRTDKPDENAALSSNSISREKFLLEASTDLEFKITRNDVKQREGRNWLIRFLTPGSHALLEQAEPKLVIDVVSEMNSTKYTDMRSQAFGGPRLVIDDGPVSKSLATELMAAIDAMEPL